MGMNHFLGAGLFCGLAATALLGACDSDDETTTSSTTTTGTGTGGAGAAGGSGGGGAETSACIPPAEVPDPWAATFLPYSLLNGSAVTGAELEVFGADDTLLGSETVDENGEAAVSVATGGTPLDAYFTASAPSYLTTRFRIQGGLGWFPRWSTMMGSTTWADQRVQDAWGVDRDPGAAMVYVAVLRCNAGNELFGLEGATVTLEPGGTEIVYVDRLGGFDPVLTATSPYGFALAANVPAGDNTLTVTLDGEETTYQRPMRAGTIEAILVYPSAATCTQCMQASSTDALTFSDLCQDNGPPSAET
ncbi:MAG: hypothetical protein JRI68_31230, partial [Deltaproteobacteria bacterium]|nr:hypothetical protein [Deltaproteobacteria bacterium]